MEEVKEEMWSCDVEKTSSSSGFTHELCRTCWDILKQDVMNFIEEFHENSKFPKAITATFIALVPKVENPQHFGEYRPFV